MSHEKSITVSNKAGTSWWNEGTVGKSKGKKLGGTYKTMESAVSAAKKRSASASKTKVRPVSGSRKRGPQ
jgi:hypothetical protein